MIQFSKEQILECASFKDLSYGQDTHYVNYRNANCYWTIIFTVYWFYSFVSCEPYHLAAAYEERAVDNGLAQGLNTAQGAPPITKVLMKPLGGHLLHHFLL